MCSPCNDNVILHTRWPNCQQKVCLALFLCSGWFFFVFEELKSTFFTSLHFAHEVCTNHFRCLEGSNRVRMWNKIKKFIYVWSKLQLCQLEIPIFIYKLMWQGSLINSVSFVLCEFNGVSKWNEGKTTILVRSSIKIPKYKY